jgi:SAM-dependent methyltransferase
MTDPTWWQLPRGELDRALRGAVADLGGGAGSFVDPASAQALRDLAPRHLVSVDDAEIAGGPGCRVRADLDRGAPLADGRFDAAVCSHVLEHLPHAERLIADVARILRPGGFAIVAVPNGHSLSDWLFRAWYRATHLRGGRYRGHVRRWRLTAIRAALEESGLAVCAVTRIGESYSWLRKHRRARAALLALHRRAARCGDFFAYGWHIVARKP